MYVRERVFDGFNFAFGAVTQLRCSLCVCAYEDGRTRVLNWVGSQPALGTRVSFNWALSFLVLTRSQRHTVTWSHRRTPTPAAHVHYTCHKTSAPKAVQVRKATSNNWFYCNYCIMHANIILLNLAYYSNASFNTVPYQHFSRLRNLLIKLNLYLNCRGRLVKTVYPRKVSDNWTEFNS